MRDVGKNDNFIKQLYLKSNYEVEPACRAIEKAMNNFQQAKVTQGMPTQKPRRMPFSLPIKIEPKCVAPIGGIHRIIIIMTNLVE